LNFKINVCLFITALMLTAAGCKTETDNPVIPGEEDILTEPLDPYKQNKLLGRGINLGNSLEAPKEGDWGVQLKEEFFVKIKEKGFNSVRVPIKWSSHASQTAPYTIDEIFFKRIDWVIDQSLLNGLVVIINIHHYDEMMSDPAGNKDRFLHIWDQISKRYIKTSGKLFFEILNEPNNQLNSSLWNQYLKDAITVIRKSNPYRTLIVGTANWNSIGNLSTISLPEDDRNIIVTYHYYSPFNFTHQGAEWVDGSNEWLGTKWFGTPQEQAAIMNDFDQALAWSINNNRPLHMGEFGAFSKADIDSRVRWTTFVTRAAEKKGFSWSYWEFCSGFGVYNQQSGEWLTGLLNALIPNNV